MQALSLIPFVVGVINLDSCVKNSSDVWKHGPEYRFRIGVNGSINHPKLMITAASNVTIALKCRPFSSDSVTRNDGLQCYVKDAQIRNFELNLTSQPPKMKADEPPGPFEISDRKFEILYDKKGITELRIDPLLSAWRLNMLRLIASHLNFGFDRFDKGGERFAVVEVVGHESSTIGECETKFEVSKQMTNKGKRWTSECGDKIHLETYAYGNKNPMIAMDKTRDTKKCSKSTPYVFGADGITKEKPPFFKTQMISSVTSFSVGPQNFQSHSKNLAILTHDNDTQNASVEEEIDLVLESIDPASSELKRISDPSFTTIFADDQVHKVKKA